MSVHASPRASDISRKGNSHCTCPTLVWLMNLRCPESVHWLEGEGRRGAELVSQLATAAHYRVVMNIQSHLWAQSQAEPCEHTHTHTRPGNSQQDAASISSAEWGMTTDLTIGRQHTGVLLVTRVVFLEACRQLHFPWWEYAKLIKSCWIGGGGAFFSNDCLHFTHSLRDPRLVLKDRLWTGPMGPVTASGLQAEINAETSHCRCKIEIDRRTVLRRVPVTVEHLLNTLFKL